jgi:hypothetical protein
MSGPIEFDSVVLLLGWLAAVAVILQACVALSLSGKFCDNAGDKYA